MSTALDRPRLRSGRPALAVAALLALAALAGCTSTSTMDAGSGAEAAPAVPAPRVADGQPGTSASGDAVPAVELLGRSVIQRAHLTVRASDVARARERARTTVADAGGFVADERTETGKRGQPRRSTLTLRVPSDAFDVVLGDLGRLGRVQSQQVSTEDVSTQVVDVEARIVSAERTLDRLRELLQQADDFSDVLSLESELSRREADLASLKAQQAYLDDQTSLSTIALTLRPRSAAAGPDDSAPTGFVAGLGVGWDALTRVVGAALTGLGVMTPLLALLVPVGLLAWWAVRRLLRRQPLSPPAA